MPTETVEADYGVDAWAGTLDDVADLFDRLHQLVSEAVGGEEEIKPSITVDLENGDLQFDSLAEFREWGSAGKLEDARALRCWCAPWPMTPLKASLVISKSPPSVRGGVRLSLSGTNSVAVSGISQEIRKQIDRGKRRRARSRDLHLLLLALIGLLAVGTVLVAYESVPAAVALGMLWVAASVLNVFASDIALRLVPEIELLKSRDSPTVYQRWRGRLLAGTGALALVVIGAVLQVILSG